MIKPIVFPCPFLLILLCLASCSSIKEPESIRLIVRKEPGKIIDGSASYSLVDRTNGVVLAKGSTNDLGIASISRPTNKRFADLDISVTHNGVTDSIQLNPYNDFYELYLDARTTPVPEHERVADFHYHLSMKPHNTYAQFYYIEEPEKSRLPRNLAWVRLSDKLRVYHKGEWRKPVLKQKIGSEDDRQLMRTYLENRWVRTKDGANSFKNFTQATSPHSIDGNVYLAFNAISPFEHSVSNERVKRFVSSNLKSGADIKWLYLMGDKENYLSHWENFNYELKMINSQDTTYNNFNWHFLPTDASGANLDRPTVVNVVEGAHILQDKYFPHFINFDLMDSTSKEKDKLYETIKARAKVFAESEEDVVTLDRIEKFEASIRQDEGTYRATQSGEARKNAGYRAHRRNLRSRFIDSLLIEELVRNIDSLKRLNIHMISVSHLSYNGMVGHAPALDVSQKPLLEKFVSIMAQRAYSIRVSNDKAYRKAYDGLFYRVPGVNAFGDTLINHLLDASKGRRIQIDFKHADVLSRKYLMQKYDEMKELGDSIRPICSHCAVNGLPIGFSSPLVNEYRMLHSKLSRKFYPFAINLYNEEVKEFCEKDGIIGIPLEERVLGGYLNNRIQWPITIRRKKKQYYIIEEPSLMKRANFTEAALRMLDQRKNQDKLNALDDVKAYYRSFLGRTISERDLLTLICEEYFSAEPFMQNLFHIVDIAYTVERETREVRFVKDVMVKEVVRTRSNKDSLISAASNVAKTISDERFSIDKSRSWKNVCLGSDLDGLIDPINICPTASQYPFFKEKLQVMIPLFLYIRKNFERRDKILGIYRTEEDYFDAQFGLKEALDMLFYTNLKEFTEQTLQP